MSELSYLEKLLDGVEVEWKTLEDITLRTSNIKWREVIRSYRYIDLTSVDIATKKITETTEITKNNAPSRAQKLVDENDVIFATTRPTQQRFCLIDSEYAGEVASTGYCILRAKQDQVLPKWILHWISTSDFKKHVEENQSGSAYPAISDSKVKECLIPIPCPDNPEKSLAIQSEIVRILDKFTALTAELTAELNMRKKQYNYYRDQLLSFKEGEVEWKTLEEVLVDKFWIMPATPKFDDNGEIPYITSKNISGGNIDFERVKHISRDDFLSISKNRPILKGDFLISMIGTIGEIARVKCLDPDFYGQNMYLIRLNEELLHPRYFLHFFDSPRMKFYFKSVKNNSGQGYLKANNIDGLSIPLPSIDEQQKIAFILDKFDTLTNSITEGLPREIELRQKQYEYYRDLLFSFPKPETVSN
ncbi:TPA: restriction endonuclease subunit S [Escherichia coli]|uniref:Restriction endonuclease subunit S n=1 Tax=Escherichia coli TaxID=562 RepID=A0A8H9T591_ECOLX|nr:restriction endonuclease subunit S [Escherichia coli]MCV9036153.1 restriction endonuclease subunit S [Escherichia coli]MDN1867492.1 restriction endonuclease subunit S [Escherichia coli]HBB1573938.1 restriction endonuclease subunit S [Escherichia coli]HBH4619693.1 restriction endonuclease subunit S [Escherichia coli]